ncbi:MAG: aspartate aminotransferase family protein [marine bacterium B5-7]|nr:MAG: aspartate aminotransferase family protein [marine bacterium B5-7]
MNDTNYPSAFLHPFSNIQTLERDGPMVVTHGEGVYIFDDKGQRYLEGNSGLWNVVLGFDNPRLIEAAQKAYGRMPAYHAFFGRVTESALELSERLVSIAPMPATRVFYANSGSEANDSIIKLLWILAEAEGKPHRRLILSRRNAYHGMTVAASSLTGKDYVRSASGLPLPEVRFLSCPHHWREALIDEDEETFSARLADELDRTIRNTGADCIAGFFAEPVMGAGGVIPPPRGYFDAIQTVLRRYNIPLIADEVICGFGRTGSFWGSLHYGIEPDIVVASKVLTAGFFPMGAVILSPDMSERLERAAKKLDELPHGFTTGAHPVGCAIAMAALDELEAGAFDNVTKVAPVFQKQLNAMSDHPLIGESRGVGLMGALELVADKTDKTPFADDIDISERVAVRALHHGLVCRPLGQAVVLAPPFIIKTEQIEELFSILRRVLDEVQDDVSGITT